MSVAFILAGGFGTRLAPVVSNVPKPMANIGSRPFLEFLLDYWISQGVTQFVLCVGYMHTVIVSHFGDQYRDCRIQYVVETTPLGTGGALLNAINYTSQVRPFILLNGDTMFPVPSKELLNANKLNHFGVVFSLFVAAEGDRYGAVKLDKTGTVTDFNGAKAKVGQFANGGVYAINPRLIKEKLNNYTFPCSLEEDILPDLSASGVKFSSVVSSADFIDIGVPRDYGRAQKFINDIGVD